MPTRSMNLNPRSNVLLVCKRRLSAAKNCRSIPLDANTIFLPLGIAKVDKVEDSHGKRHARF